MLTRKAFLALLLAFFVLELSRNAPNTICYSNLVLVITGRAILTRFNARKLLKLTDVTFGTTCIQGTTNRFFTGGAAFTQCRIGWVGECICGTICGRIHACCWNKFITSSGRTILVDVERGRVLAKVTGIAGLVVGCCPF